MLTFFIFLHYQIIFLKHNCVNIVNSRAHHVEKQVFRELSGCQLLHINTKEALEIHFKLLES